MKFGKLADISTVDFQLPQNHQQTESFLSNLSPSIGKPQLFVGCTGWSMKEWIGKIYPKGTKASDYLHFYSRQFNTIELNTTHYRIPTNAIIQKWKGAIPKDFQFCPKIPQSISHSRDLGLSGQSIELFCEAIQGLELNLGCCFMQLPPYFDYKRLGILEHFLQRFPSHIPLAIEIRHESWFSDAHALQSFFQLLERLRFSSVITDVAGRRDVLHQGITSTTAMIRFVGNNLLPSDYSRIDEWIIRLDEWFKKGLRKVYFFPHEPDNILAPDLSLYLVTKVQEQLPYVEVRGPQFLQEKPPQLSLF